MLQIPSAAFRSGLIGISLSMALGCTHSPVPKPEPSSAKVPIHLAVVRDALSLKGIRYQLGEKSPEKGFDCSGFVHFVYGKQGVVLPRTSFEMAQSLPVLDETLREAGDLVFFNTTGKPFSHVGIYVGSNLFVHASSARGHVLISGLDAPYWARHYMGARRARHLNAYQGVTQPSGRWYP